MNRDEMTTRTKQFALRIMNLAGALPRGRIADHLGRQLIRSGTSVGANYREAIRSSSRRQYLSKLEIAEREADETTYWLELIEEGNIMPSSKLAGLYDEAQQLVAILTASAKTTRRNNAE
jgi:four helix bundle protein